MAGDTPITVIGNLTGEPQLQFTKNGVSYATFTVASTPRTFDKQANEWRDGDALFLRCSVWRQLAEHVAESLEKGARVIVTGRLKQRNYEKDGEKRSAFEIDVEEIGPSLRYATAKVNRATRSSDSGGFRSDSGPSNSGYANDPWASAPAASNAGGAGFSDAPPF